MNKSIYYLGLSILDLSKTVVYGENAKLCYMDTGSFIVHVKTRYLQRFCRRC